MLKINTRYILRHKDTEKIINIKTKEEKSYWDKYFNDPEFQFTEVVVHERKEECESCQA